MKRIRISLDADVDAILARMARDEGTSKAALVRRFVRERVGSPAPPERDPIWEMLGTVDVDPVPGESIDDVVLGLRPTSFGV